MKYYALYNGEYLDGLQRGGAGEQELTEEEYNDILTLIRNKPTAEEGYDYRLKKDLTWEKYELPVVEADPDPEISDSEALDIILGGEG